MARNESKVTGFLGNAGSWMAKALIFVAIAMLGRSGEAQSKAVDMPTDGHLPNPEDCGFVVDEGDLTYAQVGTIDGDSHTLPYCAP